ncbi:MAG TPA: hypothetical protein DDZ68_14965 [Parvularcula sp.]|nr:hypothetical protein [Parvularcula sp.]HBS33439.1 hypothetical protein [Parvularcula sp.]
MAAPFFGSLAWIVAAAGVFAAPAAAQGQFHENGAGPDPDGDTNPATRTYALASIGAEDARLDPRFRVISFEPPPGGHNDAIGDQYARRYGVNFSKGLKRQICEEGQRYFRYDTFCAYIAPPSGAYAAHYRTDRRDPLVVSFKTPVCAAALSIYPIGGREGERFEATLTPYAGDRKLKPASVRFAWTSDTFRWRTMVGGFFLDQSADRVEILVESRDNEADIVQFLVDDFGVIETDCENALEDIRKATGFEVAEDTLTAKPAEE